MKRTQAEPEFSRSDVFGAILEERARRFGEVDQNSRIYGKLHGREDLFAFGRHVDPEFEDPAHIRKIGEQLIRVERGEQRRLIINAPPRHGKTLFSSKIFPAWFLGRNPRREIISTAYGADLVSEITGRQRDICESREYREIFPMVRVRGDSRARERWKTTVGGVVLGSGTGGAITGYGAHLLNIDDPIKNFEEALSPTYQERAWDWYRTVARTRVYANGAIVITMTRWAEFDLVGKILAQDGRVEDGGLWTVLRLPAIDENGNALWPERFNINELNEIRKTLGEKLFSALYLQEPIDIQEKLFENPTIEEPPSGLTYYAFLDPAFTTGVTSDYSALSILGIDNKIIDRSRAELWVRYGEIWKRSIDVIYDLVERACIENNVSVLYVECNNGGDAIYEALKKRKTLKVEKAHASGNKTLRIVDQIRGNWGRLRFSRFLSPAYFNQILKYNDQAAHDDAPDSLASLIKKVASTGKSLRDRYSWLGRIG
ncbi:terminase [Leptospira santarosai]|uniref:terminase n=1 Tax=Leptospira santarosai TaxID=28183 RepID=UPI000772EF4C|nr:terminase [Leptospira santarosai]